MLSVGQKVTRKIRRTKRPGVITHISDSLYPLYYVTWSNNYFNAFYKEELIPWTLELDDYV